MDTKSTSENDAEWSLKNSGKSPYLYDGEWLSVEDEMPTETGQYLVVIKGHNTMHMDVDHFDIDDYMWECELNDDAVRVSHYQNLPAFPSFFTDT